MSQHGLTLQLTYNRTVHYGDECLQSNNCTNQTTTDSLDSDINSNTRTESETQTIFRNMNPQDK